MNAVAGFGDAASFGLSGFIRRHTPGGDGVDYGSGAYAGGAVAGVAAISVVGGALPAAADGTAVAAEEAEAGEQVLESGTIWRSGGANPGNLTAREGEEAVSMRNSLSNPVSSREAPVFRSGGKATEIDVAKLPRGSAVLDNNPAGHVSVTATPEQIKAAVVRTVKIP